MSSVQQAHLTGASGERHDNADVPDSNSKDTDEFKAKREVHSTIFDHVRPGTLRHHVSLGAAQQLKGES